MSPRVIQIAAAGDGDYGRILVFALMSDGTIWRSRDASGFRRMKGPRE